MPALQRTPPQRVGKSPAKPYDRPTEPIVPENAASPARTPSKTIPRPSEGISAIPTTPRAFLPRAQKVMRTPPEGMASSASMPPPPAPVSRMEEDMDIEEVERDTERFVEEQIAAGTSTAPRHSVYPTPEESVGVAAEISTAPRRSIYPTLEKEMAAGTSTAPRQSLYPTLTPSTDPPISEHPVSTTPVISPQPRKSTTPLHSPPKASAAARLQSSSAEAGPSTQPVPASVATSPRTPRTRRTAPPAVTDPLPEIQVDEASQWGRRYELTRDTLNIAIKKSTEKWTKRDLEGIFPLLAAKFPQELKQIHSDASSQMRKRIEKEALEMFEHYRVGRAMQMLDAVVEDGRQHAAGFTEMRPDAWRPDLTPEALVAAANLGIYDEAHERLRSEYLALHADCSTRFSSIQAKQAQLAELEKSVSESVTELDQTLQTLDGFPTGEMKDWAETTMGRMEGGRVVEKA